MDEKGFGGLARMREYAKEFAQDTELVNFDVIFDDQYALDLGGLTVIAKIYGSAHSPGVIVVSLSCEGGISPSPLNLLISTLPFSLNSLIIICSR